MDSSLRGAFPEAGGAHPAFSLQTPNSEPKLVLVLLSQGLQSAVKFSLW